jgi:hypothetical protein
MHMLPAGSARVRTSSMDSYMEGKENLVLLVHLHRLRRLPFRAYSLSAKKTSRRAQMEGELHCFRFRGGFN